MNRSNNDRFGRESQEDEYMDYSQVHSDTLRETKKGQWWNSPITRRNFGRTLGTHAIAGIIGSASDDILKKGVNYVYSRFTQDKHMENSGQHADIVGISPLDILDATSPNHLEKTIKGQPYSFDTTSTLRQLLLEIPKYKRSEILGFAERLIIEKWNSDKEQELVGILITLISTCTQWWQPTKKAREALKFLCYQSIGSGTPYQVSLVEPMAFSLARFKKFRATHRDCLKTLVCDADWLRAQADKNNRYYPSDGAKVAACLRHSRDKQRTGLQLANSIPTILDMIEGEAFDQSTDGARERLVGILAKNLKVLKDNDESELANQVVARLEDSKRKLLETTRYPRWTSGSI